MSDQVIVCPFCRKEIPLTEAISHQIREELKKEFEIGVKKKEEALLQREEALSRREKELKAEVSRLVDIEKKRIEEEAKKRAEETISLEIKDLKEQLLEKDRRLQESQTAELQLRKERRELEERHKSLELELSRRLDEERERIREEAAKAVLEEHRLKDLEKEKKISDMLQQIEELKRRAEQGPIQITGEVLEIELEEILRNRFPIDQIEAISRGKKGADVLQRVHNPSGQYCGTIIWEAKRTKGWNEGWIDKLKEDQREAKAEIAVIVTTAMPKEVEHFQLIDGVWVTNFNLVACLAIALRTNLIQVANERKAAEGKHEKMEALYGYLSGSEFSQKVEAIVKAFLSMRNDLESEKAAMNKIWAKREKQIERVITNITRMYGDMQGIIGASLPEIKSLEFKNLTEFTEPEY
ncbi:MAG: DUF2130 domain-containing protein [Syntrophaceae bacterium]|nr:DUF2130 domain-containing protein [Syntrophaceae bacterium]